MQEAGSPYLPLAFELYPHDVTEELWMSRKRTSREDNLRYFINRIGPETIVRLLPPETFAEAIESQSPTERAQWMRALLERFDPNEVEAWLHDRRASGQG